LSIIVFILIGVVVMVHWMWGVRWAWAWLAAPAYLLVSVGLSVAIRAVGGDRAVLGGYIPALILLAAFGLAIRLTVALPGARFGTWLLGAAAIFAASLTLRTLDEPLCQSFSLGTHFAWHLFNATVLFLVSYVVIRRWQGSGK